MLDSLYTGTAGIKANSKSLSVVGSNISNVGTVGYKAANTSFENVLTNAMGSGKVGSKEVWSQGSLEQTAITTDLAIVGEGMFQLKDAAGAIFYTRDGSFHLNEEGILVNTTGLEVQGFKIGNNGELNATGGIQISNVNSPPVASTKMGVDFNLDGGYTAANVMVDCSDNFSSITYTAMTPGSSENDINIRYIDSGSGGPVVSAEGSSLTIDMGGQDLTAAQAAAMVNAYFNVAAETEIGSGDAAVQFVADEAGAAGNDVQIKYATGTALDVAVSELASGTKIVTVTVVGGTTTAAQVAEAVNSDTEASALVTGIAKGKGTGVVSTYAEKTIGTDDAAVTFTAENTGSDGNDITIEYVKSGTGTPLSVSVSGNAITVNLATDGTGDVSSTAAAIVAAVNGDTAASALVTASGEGTTAVADESVSATNLKGGTGEVDIYADKTIGTDDAAVTFTAETAGSDGNDITIEYVKSGTGTPLSVSVSGNAITVNLATDGTGAVTSTAAAIVAAINGDTDASALVTASGNGTTAVADESVLATNLTGGAGQLATGPDYLLDGRAGKTVGEGDAAVLFVADEAGSDGEEIQIEYTTGTELGVSVASDVITVTLEEGCSAMDIAALINDHTAASALVTAIAGGSGEVPYEVVAKSNLEDGKSPSTIPTAQVNAIASGDGTGLIEVSAPVSLNGGGEPKDYSNTIGVFDSLGNQIDLTVDYIFDPVLELDEDGNLNTLSQWSWNIRSSEGSVDDISGVLRFDSSGQLDRVKSTWTDASGSTDNLRDGGNPKIIVTDLNSGAADLNIEWDLSITTSVTGFSGLSEVTYQIQDGYTSGSLNELSVDEDGIITGTFSNGATKDLYQVGVASFQNYDGLSLKGTNVFTATDESGAAMFGEPGSGNRGTISPGSLELSNVDLAEEFVNMITIQRAYQANSRVITTSSDILQELINLKR